MSLKIIVAMANNRVIGKDNRMPWHIPEDLAHFKQTTLGQAIIMGHNTYLSIGKALPERKNIVLSRDVDLVLPDAEVMHDFAKALAKYPDAFIIGGAVVFAAALPLAEYLYITHIDDDIEGDTYFPEVDWTLFKCLNCQAQSAGNGQYQLRYCVYQRKTVETSS